MSGLLPVGHYLAHDGTPVEIIKVQPNDDLPYYVRVNSDREWWESAAIIAILALKPAPVLYVNRPEITEPVLGDVVVDADDERPVREQPWFVHVNHSWWGLGGWCIRRADLPERLRLLTDEERRA